MIAKDKVHMAGYLADAMSSSYARYRAVQELERDTGLLKSYFVEAHATSPEQKSPHDAILAFLLQLSQKAKFQVLESQDESLFNIQHANDAYYLDVSNSRFWIIHTLALSARADRLRSDLIKISPSLDSAWLPTQLLERLTQLGHFRGFGAIHDESPFTTEEMQDEPEVMRLRLWGGSAPAVLKALRMSGIFAHSLALSSVRLKYWLPDLPDESVIDNFTFEGKVTALGKSFTSHANLVAKLHLDYIETIERIEDGLQIRFAPIDGIPTLHGHPIVIQLAKELPNLPNFVAKVFSSSLPFRLWGLSEFYADDSAMVHAVDLHVGHKLTFEIAKDYIRIYLPPGTCANSIARFYTNLQHYYDSAASISGGPNGELF